jgi:hypothetical protein
MLLVVSVALACESTVMARLPVPTTPPPKLTVETTTAALDGATYTGAQVSVRSPEPVTAWTRVIEHPELQPTWHPRSLGTERVERIEGTNYYQRTAISVLGFTVRRQVIAQIRWLTSTPALLHTCWTAGDPTAYAEKVKAWDEGSTWQRHGFGGWTISSLPDGGSLVDYQVWVDTNGIPAALVSWGVSRTLPTLVGAFEARVQRLAAADPQSPDGALAEP